MSLQFKKINENPIFQRKECIVKVFHTGKHYGKLDDIKTAICQSFKLKDPKLVVLYGFESKIGGNTSEGFCCVYKNMDALKVAEPEYNQIRIGVKDKKKPVSRKQIKTTKNKGLKKFGTHVKKEVQKKKK